MTDRIRIFQILNEQIFATLGKYLKQFELQQQQQMQLLRGGGGSNVAGSTQSGLSNISFEQVKEFDPPANYTAKI